MLRRWTLLVGFGVLTGCQTLPSREIPTALPITQVNPSYRAAEYVFCDLKGGAWGCQDASRKTPFKAQDAIEPRTSDGFAILPRQKAVDKTGAPLLTVFFDFNSARISDEQVLELIALARTLSQSPRINVTGFTDNIGPEHYNGFLAQRRAAAVKRILMENGVEPRHIRAFGKGKCCYAEDNKHAAGRARNRRVTISL